MIDAKPWGAVPGTPCAKIEDSPDPAPLRICIDLRCRAGFDKNGVWMGRSSRGILQHDQMKLAVGRVAAMREIA